MWEERWAPWHDGMGVDQGLNYPEAIWGHGLWCPLTWPWCPILLWYSLVPVFSIVALGALLLWPWKWVLLKICNSSPGVDTAILLTKYTPHKEDIIYNIPHRRWSHLKPTLLILEIKVCLPQGCMDFKWNSQMQTLPVFGHSGLSVFYRGCMCFN